MRFFIVVVYAVLSWGVPTATAGPNEAMEAFEKGDYGRALKEFRELALDGDPAAQNNLAVIYANGMGTDVDYVQAARWYLRAAEQGLPIAQYNMGTFYERGLGVEKDLETATIWYRLAAEQGDDHAQFNLGKMLFANIGAETDSIESYMWLTLAAARTADVRLRADALAARKELEKSMDRNQVLDAQFRINSWKPAR